MGLGSRGGRGSLPEKSRSDAGLGVAIAVGLFIALASLVIFDRGRIEVDFTHLNDGGDAFYRTNLPFCPGLPACMRVGTAILGYGIEKLLLGLSGLYFSGDAAYRLFAPEVVVPQGMYAWQRVVLDPARMEGLVVPIAATVLLRALCLSAILWVALRFFSAVWERLAFLLVTFGVLLGWPVPLVLGFFGFMSTIVDWPNHHFLFVYFTSSYDFGALGFVYVLLLVLARQDLPSLGQAALIAGAGQLIFENLGLVAGVSISLVVLLRTPRETTASAIIRSGTYLAATGVASLAVAAVLIWGVISAGSAPDVAAGSAGRLTEHLAQYWRDYGQNNLTWWRVLVADSISVLIFPVVLGTAAGLGEWLLRRNDESFDTGAIRTQLLAVLGVATGFTLSLVPGFFVSGLASDMHRQIAPLACLSVLVATRGVTVLLTRHFSGEASPPR